MNKLLFVAVLLIVSFLSYVVYAVTQPSNEGKSADEIIASLFSPDVEKMADKQGLERLAYVKSLGAASETKAKELRQQDVHVRSLEVIAEKSPLKLSIAPARDEQAAWIREIEMTFTNISDEPVKIIKPLDGSYYGWYQPHYRFTVRNSEDEELKLSGRCGNSGLWADTTFPENYLVELQPAETHQIKGYLPFVVPKTGRHKISFEYIYNFEETDVTSPKENGSFEWSSPVEGAWQGAVKSNTITLDLNKND